MVSRITQRFHLYFQGFSDLPLQSKVTRLALPVVVGLAGLVCCGLLASRLIHYLNPPVKSKNDASATPKDEKYGDVSPEMLNPYPPIYQIKLNPIAPTLLSSYIHAARPAAAVENDRSRFIQTAIDKAGLIVTMGNLDHFAFLETPQKLANSLDFKSGQYTSTPEYKAGELSVQSEDTQKKLWHIHLYIGFFSVHTPLDKLHEFFETLSKFIAEKGINLTDKPMMISSEFANDSARFILYHHLYNDFKTLVEKESKDQTDDQIADKILQNNDIQVLLKDRQGLIKKLLSNLDFEIHSPEQIAKYRDVVLLPMIRRMREGSAAPAQASPPASASLPPPARSETSDERIGEKLKMFDGLGPLSNIDPDKEWEKWDAFIQQMGQCHTQLLRECSLDTSGSCSKICTYLANSHLLESLPLCQSFHRALKKALEIDSSGSEVKYNGYLCVIVRGFIEKFIKEQGYDFFKIREGQTVAHRLFALTPLVALTIWYRENRKMSEAEHIDKFMTTKESDSSTFSLLQPLRALKNGLQTPEQERLLKLILVAFDKDAKIATKTYLNYVLKTVPDDKTVELVRDKQKEQQPHGPLFLLLGEHVTSENSVFEWLSRLYQVRIEKSGEHILDTSAALSPSLYSQVKKKLAEILSNPTHLKNLVSWGPEGRCILLSIWQQMEEEELLKAVRLLFRPEIDLNMPAYSTLLDVWEQFATDPTRITNHPEECDLILERLYRQRAANVKDAEFKNWKQTSIWATLQQNEKLHRLRETYKTLS